MAKKIHVIEGGGSNGSVAWVGVPRGECVFRTDDPEQVRLHAAQLLAIAERLDELNTRDEEEFARRQAHLTEWLTTAPGAAPSTAACSRLARALLSSQSPVNWREG